MAWFDLAKANKLPTEHSKMTHSNPPTVAALQQLNSDEFEALVARLWRRMGWDTTLSSPGSDRGIDVIATKTDPYPQKLLIQAKRYQTGNKITSPDIREYNSLKQQESAVDQVIIVTTSQFTSEALSIAKELNVKCVDGTAVAEMVQSHGGDELLPKSPAGRRDPDSVSCDNKRAETGTDLLRSTGRNLTMTLRGIAPADFDTSSPISIDSQNFQGLFICAQFETKNLDSHTWLPLDKREEVVFTDSTGTNHHPIGLDEDPLPVGWQTHDPQKRTAVGPRNLDIAIQLSNNTSYLAAVPITDPTSLRKIEIPRYDLKFSLDAADITRLSSLPADVVTSLDSVPALTTGSAKE